jgi:hypothetical protein
MPPESKGPALAAGLYLQGLSGIAGQAGVG